MCHSVQDLHNRYMFGIFSILSSILSSNTHVQSFHPRSTSSHPLIHPSKRNNSLRGSLNSSRSIGIRNVLDISLLAILYPICHQPSFFPRFRLLLDRTGLLTFHLANLNSISPLFSACNLLSSFKLRRTTRAATARYLL